MKVNGIHIFEIQELPSGEKIAHVPCYDQGEFEALPRTLEIDGETYGRAEWNASPGVYLAYYRTDPRYFQHIR